MKKRIFMILLIAVFITAMSFAATILVLEPRTGATWYVKNPNPAYHSDNFIKWKSPGVSSSEIVIELYKDVILPAHLKLSFIRPNTGMTHWEIPDYIESGYYYIRIKTPDNSVHGDSGRFEIRNPVLDKKRAILSHHINFHIRIIEPKTSTTWFEGKRYNIIWNNIYTKGKHIKIGLYNFNGKSLIKVIYDGNDVLSPTTGKSESTYSWIVPKGLGSFTGKRYKIKIYTIGGTKSIKGSVDITIKVPISLHSR